ncbi:MAG: hypothetical protein LBB85_02205 [Dysgonamonadaceae bacterium]|jgi:hypothetical protein|nr:hypothetical protein [Dysgonamonadaceae bacterium]
MDTAKADKTHKCRATAIRDKRILFSRENSKLCLGQPEMLRASQDPLAPAYSRRRLPPKSEALMKVESPTANVQ